MNKLPNIQVSGEVLSDLFFNSELTDSTNDETLLKSAIDFAAQFDGQVTARELFNDFKARV